MDKITAGIVGGAGYTGGELLRVLIHHPRVAIDFVHSKSNAGKPLHSVHGDLLGDTDMLFAAEIGTGPDVLFLCVGHGDAKKFLEAHPVNTKTRVIDLSQDFRLDTHGRRPVLNSEEFIYGLPELNRSAIMEAHHIANPGCFATAVQLGLLPLAKAGLLGNVHTTGITGSTGAGQGLSPTSHFSWRSNNIQAYKTLTHQHLHEIGQSLSRLQPDGDIRLNFVPWRGDFTRGIFISSQLTCNSSLDDLYALYEEYYVSHPFTLLSRQPIHLKQVVNTNKCFIQLETAGDELVVHSIMDNLLKGASGQAVQNMNLLFGFEETLGLRLKANYF